MSDLTLYRHVQSLSRHTAWLHGTAAAWATYGVVAFALLLLGGYLVARSRDDLEATTRALLGPVAVLVAVALNQPVVHAVGRARPFTVVPDALVLVHRSVDATFPSDHATMAGATAVAVLLVSRRLGALAVVAALAMAATRVYVGAHYPGDVLAGLALGGAVAAVVVLLGARALAPLVRRLSRSRLRPLLLAA